MTTTIAEKLLIKSNSTVWLNEPSRLPLLTPMPEGVRETGVLATAGTAVLFVEDAAGAREQLAEHRADLGKPGAFWIAYQKDGAPALDLSPIVADYDMRACDQVVIDERWSALRCEVTQPG
ncbi:hypothetical protein AMIS_5280 [Actinoplanes missouriensis 431]|uniref:DUF3052 domain-containing protein n=1 Tax=Actinoplanes missouriensis (strain ATCC 14538 / DSM 43046 / CBS 188.64 / JCM 3121 / NBRC 102363 / NCIMB 12654 / NRRL B-3342 / UNCC 431) TaxID=512565 RepID=I0GYB1_ACTM4|nr:hypothetical protein [Actinoplanes missouriensis]BAL85748.1 hypothetical protein AMIS_5280 [Actinoplanes missouriensis 431]